jgi:nicotinamidase-related amidase
MNKFRVEACIRGEWILLCGAATVEGAEVTAGEWRGRGWHVRVVECAA